MRNKVLYFPYINVPNSTWFTRMLLYWDEVGTIVPYDYIEEPERFGEHTRSLVQAGLVTQVIPGIHLHKISHFTESFSNYLESLGAELEIRRKAFKGLLGERKVARVHIEKMNDIGHILVDMGLAEKRKYPWYFLEPQTGIEFMIYLAATLGNLDDLHCMPITDEFGYLHDYIYSSSPDMLPEQKISSLRLQILDGVFPSPNKPLTANEIADFKNKHGNTLSDFRRKVERELITLAEIDDNNLRQRQLDLFMGEAHESIEEIINRLNESGYNRLTLGKIGSIIAAIPSVSGIVRIGNAIYNAFEKSESLNMRRSFLYAAHAQRELLQKIS